MVSKNSKIAALLILLCVGFACKPFSRLMSKGGTIYTVEIQTDEPSKDEIVERAVKITQARMNALGLDGEVSRVADKPNQISVKLYGANDVARIKKFLFTTNQLELKKVNSAYYQGFSTKEQAEQTATAEQEVLPFSERADDSAPQKFIIVEKKAVITGEYIRDAHVYANSNNANDNKIQFSLNPEGATKFGDWTGTNIGSYLAIILDKKAISTPVIKGQIFDSGVIEGKFTKTQAENLALSLKSGYLPATMNVLEEKTFN